MVLAVLGDGFGQSRSARLITNSVYTRVSECVTYLHIGVPARTRFYASRIHEFTNDLPMKSIAIDFASKATQKNYEITMMTLKGETFAGFKIQR